ncbi:MAG: cellulase family glycosylhydrolase [Christiangramia sp.]|nr:glycosyl hydrolase family 5 [Christiangramia sp.]
MDRIIFLLIVLLSSGMKGQNDFLHAKNKQILDSSDEPVILRGIGLGGHMLQEGYMLKVPFSGQQHVFRNHVEELIGEEKTQQFYDKWLQNFTQKADIDSLKAWGFNSVRLPMHYNLYTSPVEREVEKGKNTWLEKGFAMTDSLVSWCKANDMYLILDMHATPGGQGHDVNISDRDTSKPSLWESKENQDKLVALWKKLADRYKDEPTIGAYDMINEPNWSFEEGININGIEDSKNEPLKDLMIKITKAIREVDNNHIIIIEGNGWGNNYSGVLPPWDDNMVLSFHKYWNNNNQESIQKFIDFRDQYNIPIWLGESGENSNVWFADAISLMERNDIGWCWWPLKKIGFNNPLEIKMNPGYENILNYWKGEAEKPSEDEAFEAMMQLAENTKIQNNIIHYEVIDAMIRQPHSDEIKPYKQTSISSETEIPAVHFDMGKNGIAYKDEVVGNYYISTGGDRTAWNNGRTFRNEGVDIFSKEGDVYIGDTENSEWLQYTFNATESSDYTVLLQVSANHSEGTGEIQLNDSQNVKFSVPKSDSWTWVEIPNLSLEKGENQLKVLIDKGGFNFKTIRFQKNKS